MAISLPPWAKTPLTKTLVTTAIGGTVYGVSGLFDKLPKWLVTVAPTNLGYWLIAGTYITLVLSISAAIYYAKKAGAAPDRRMAHVLDSAGRLYSHCLEGRYKLQEFEWRVQIGADYSVGLATKMVVAPGAKPLTALTLIRGSSTAPVPNLHDVEFAVRVDEGAGHVCWLPSEDDPGRKRFLVFPIPPIEPGEPSRTFMVTSKWPGGAAKLKDVGGRETNEYTVPRQTTVAVAKAVVRIAIPNQGRYRVAFRGDNGEDLPNAKGEHERVIQLHDVEPGTVLEVAITRIQ